jgi:hypothetical protein
MVSTLLPNKLTSWIASFNFKQNRKKPITEFTIWSKITPPYADEVKNVLSFTSIPPFLVLTWCLGMGTTLSLHIQQYKTATEVVIGIKFNMLSTIYIIYYVCSEIGDRKTKDSELNGSRIPQILFTVNSVSQYHSENV